MVDSVDVVLEFLKKNRFAKAEAALRRELNGRSDLNGLLENNLPEARDSRGRYAELWSAAGFSKGFIVKEIGVGGAENRGEVANGFGCGRLREDRSGDLCPLNPNAENSGSNSVSFSKESGSIAEKFAEIFISGEPKRRGNSLMAEKRDSAAGNGSGGSGKGKLDVEEKPDTSSGFRVSDANPKSHFPDNLWSERDEPPKGCSVKALFPFPGDNASCSYDGCVGNGNGGGEMKRDYEAIETKEQLCEGADLKTNDKKFDLPPIGEKQREELPRLPPVRLRSEEKLVDMNWEERSHVLGARMTNGDNGCMIGSFLDVPVGQEISSSGTRNSQKLLFVLFHAFNCLRKIFDTSGLLGHPWINPIQVTPSYFFFSIFFFLSLLPDACW